MTTKPELHSSGCSRERLTRRDVARAAGVSVTTVTHALNPPPGARVKPATRDRVRRIARELGYRPSFVGSALRRGRTYTVGLLQPSHDAFFSFFYQQMIVGLVQAMEPENYHPLILFCDPSGRYRKVIDQGRVDGMVVLQSSLDDVHIRRVTETGIPTVVLNKGFDVAALRNAGCVHSDHAGMMQAVVEEFAALGCQTILAIHDPRQCDANRQMFKAFEAAIARRASDGLSGTTLTPTKPDFTAKIRATFAAGQRWDGVFIDGIDDAEIFLREAAAADRLPGRDFHLISSSCMDGHTTTKRLERSAYTHQPHLVGRETWAVLKALIEESNGQRTVLVPYRRWAVAGTAAGASVKSLMKR